MKTKRSWGALFGLIFLLGWAYTLVSFTYSDQTEQHLQSGGPYIPYADKPLEVVE